MKQSEGFSVGTGRPRAVKLDEYDIRILRQLVADARASNRALARAIGMSPPSIAGRIARLEAAGVIQGYSVQLDYAALGRPLIAFVAVESERSELQLDMADGWAEIPEIERVDVLTGGADLQLTLRVRDPQHLSDVLFNGLLRGRQEIRHTTTHLSLKSVESRDFPSSVTGKRPSASSTARTW